MLPVVVSSSRVPERARVCDCVDLKQTHSHTHFHSHAGRQLPKVVSVAKAREYGMLAGYGVGNRRVVNRPSKSLDASGEALALTISDCTPGTWMSWLRDNQSSQLQNLLAPRYAVQGPDRTVPTVGSTNEDTTSPSFTSSNRTASPVSIRTDSPASMRTPSPARMRTPSPARLRTPSPARWYADTLSGSN